MSFYSDLAADALSLISEYGQALPIQRVTGTLDAVAGTVTEGTPTTGTLRAVVVPGKKNQIDGLDNNLREALQAGKVRFLVAAASGAPFEPVATDKITFESETWVVAGCTPLNPAGTALLYYLTILRQ